MKGQPGWGHVLPLRDFVWLLIGVGGVAPELGAQATIAIPSSVSCPACEILVTPVVKLGGAGSRPWNEISPPTVFRGGQGRYFVGPSGDPAVVAVFDQKGKPLPGLGRYGNGPGEFVAVGWVLPGAGDSIVVFDRGNRRLSVFGPHLKFARSYPVPGVQVFRAAALPKGVILLQGQSGTRPGAGHTLHPIASDGAVLRSFGARDAALDPTKPLTDQLREVTTDGTGRVWSARVNRYEIEEWEPNGELRRWS